MTTATLSLRSLSGHEVCGWKLVYFVYLDEAGTSAKEPFAVVVGIVVHADSKWRLAEKAVNDAIARYVPESLRQDYIFHAADVSNGRNYREESWSRLDRSAFLEYFVSIPKILGISISFGIARQSEVLHTAYEGRVEGTYKPHELEHFTAFSLCLTVADNLVREYGEEDEIAVAVAEDVPSSKRLLKQAKDFVKAINSTESFQPLPHHPHTPEWVKEKGIQFRVDRIIDQVHFVEKSGAPLLQIADACAFTIRRFLNDPQRGLTHFRAMSGLSTLNFPDSEPAIAGCFRGLIR